MSLKDELTRQLVQYGLLGLAGYVVYRKFFAPGVSDLKAGVTSWLTPDSGRDSSYVADALKLYGITPGSYISPAQVKLLDRAVLAAKQKDQADAAATAAMAQLQAAQ